MFGIRGKELANLWRTRQFEYQWLRAIGGRYQDFWQCTAAALEFACASLGIDADAAQRAALMREYLRMDVWPDVPAALRALRQRGLKLALLSNATVEILQGGLRRGGLVELFDHLISTDRIRTFKPDPRAYQLGIDVTGLRREEILFVPFAGWDLAGGKWFGYRTFWNNRQAVPEERLDVVADAAGSTLTELVRYLELWQTTTTRE
jgi:2-haloacid dehalogenase